MYNLLCAVLFAVNGILRLYLGITDDRGFDFALAAVWFAGAIVWYVRFLKENKQKG